MRAMNIEDLLIAKEKTLLTIDVRSNPHEIKKYMSEEFLEIGASSYRMYFEKVLSILPQHLEWSAEISDFEFRHISEDVVIIIYNAIIKHDHKSVPRESIRSSTWKKFDDDWKIVFHQGTKISP